MGTRSSRGEKYLRPIGHLVQRFFFLQFSCDGGRGGVVVVVVTDTAGKTELGRLGAFFLYSPSLFKELLSLRIVKSTGMMRFPR